MNRDVTQTASIKELIGRYTDRKKYIILNPNVAQLEASPFFKVYPVEMKFGPDDWYYSGSGYSLTKPALMRVCGALSISIISNVRTDDGTNPDLAMHSVIGSERMPDGTQRSMAGGGTFDVNTVVRDNIESAKKKRAEGKDAYKNKTDEQIVAGAEAERAKLQRFRAQRAETNAIERMIKNMTGMATSYKKDDTGLTFVAFVTAPNMDVLLMDPQIRMMIAGNAVGATAQLYPQQQSPSLPQPQQNAGMLPAGSSSPVGELPAAVVQQEPEPADDPDALPDLPFDEPAADDNAATIRRLFAEREHNKSDAVLERMLAAPPEKQLGYIDWLTGLSMKAQAPAPQGEKKGVLSEAQIRRLYAIAKNAGYDADGLHDLIARLYGGITSVNDLTRDQYNSLCGDEKKGVASYLEAHPFVGGVR